MEFGRRGINLQSRDGSKSLDYGVLRYLNHLSMVVMPLSLRRSITDKSARLI
jgi:hypothetical protein